MLRGMVVAAGAAQALVRAASVAPPSFLRRVASDNVIAAGRYKIRPRLRKQPDRYTSPMTHGVSRQVSRRIAREMAK